MSAPRCSFIVPVHNGLEFLRPMLASLRACTPADQFELILSDDASRPETVAFLKDQKGVRLHLGQTNRGFAAACNAGAALAAGEFLIFLNSDLEFRLGWMEAMLSAGEEGVGAVGAKLLYPDGTIQHGGVFLREDRLDRVPLIASHDRVGEPGDDFEANRKQELLAVTAAAILIPRAAFESIGGFDEGYFNGYEDVDLCLKLRQAGLRVVYEPACTLVHHESKSGAGRFAASKTNQRRFLARWGGIVKPEVLVDEFLTVGPHPDFDPVAPFYASPATQTQPRVRILVQCNGNTAALAATLESVFAARVGLEDRVIAIAGSDDPDAQRYLALCDGHDDAFSAADTLDEALQDCDEPYTAWLEPGTIVTQGWLARLIRHAQVADGEAVGPLLTGVTGPQDAMGYLATGSAGHVHPNDLTHFFARELGGRHLEGSKLSHSCYLVASERFAQTLKQRTLTGHLALDVFAHRDARLVPAALLAA